MAEQLTAQRRKVHARFQGWAATANLLVLDTETTDLDGVVIEVGVVDIQGHPLFHQRVNPGVPIEPGATAVHGLTDADVLGCPSWAEVWPQLQVVLADRPVVAWNAGFDAEVLLRSVRELLPADTFEGRTDERGWTFYPPLPFDYWVDVMVPYADFWQEYWPYRGSHRWQSLDAACQQQGVSLERAHSALADATATAAIIRAVAAQEPGDWAPEDVPWDWV